MASLSVENDVRYKENTSYVVNHQHNIFRFIHQSCITFNIPTLLPFTTFMKMRFLTIASFTALLSTSANALPRPDGSVVARSAEPEDIVAAIAESANLHARGLDLRIGANPSGDAHCPATDRYGAHTFTSNQIMVAFMAGAKLSAEGKQVGASVLP
jgi:hypothetical protein